MVHPIHLKVTGYTFKGGEGVGANCFFILIYVSFVNGSQLSLIIQGSDRKSTKMFQALSIAEKH